MKQDNEWQQLLEELKVFMKQEVTAMREILANIHEQRQLILKKESSILQKIKQNYSSLYSQLHLCRSKRTDIMQKIMKTMDLSKEASFEELFHSQEMESCETRLLWEQISSLKEKIDLQDTENTALEHEIANNPHYVTPAELEKSKATKLSTAKKTKVATFPKKR